ncbi:MAG: hypothetical protein ABR616_04690 [Dermatophilaceae bacterium]
MTPPSLREVAERVAQRVVEEEGPTESFVDNAQVGRARRVEATSLVPQDLPLRPLADWDRHRQRVTDEHAGGDPNHWIAVPFTTRRELT